MKLTEKSNEVFNYVKNNGGKVTVDELVEALGRTSRSINANVTDLQKKELCVREVVEPKNEDEKKITYVVLLPDADEKLAAPEKEDK